MTKKPLAWIVDSTAYVPEELQQHPDFFSVPLNIHFGEKQYVDGVDLTPEQLYEKIKMRKSFQRLHNLPPENFLNDLKKSPRTTKKQLQSMFPQK